MKNGFNRNFESVLILFSFDCYKRCALPSIENVNFDGIYIGDLVTSSFRNFDCVGVLIKVDIYFCGGTMTPVWAGTAVSEFGTDATDTGDGGGLIFSLFLDIDRSST